jgi:hypothetical protein
VIACPACGFDNPLGTRFCRSCGGKIEVKLSHIVGSIEQTKQQYADDRIARAGRNALTLTLFLLICALVFRWIVVPKMPPADLPPVPLSSILPDQRPTAVVSLPTATLQRLPWRRDYASALVGSLGVDLVQLEAWQQAIVATQLPEGSFPGDDPLAATGLAALALQAYPHADAVITAAAKARAYLQANTKDLQAKAPLGRSLLMAALLDAEELPPATYNSFSMYLVDGKAPVWQAFAIPLFNAKDRPKGLNLLRSTNPDPMWGWYFDLIDGKAPAIEAKAYFVESSKTVASGEQRMLWAFTAWHFAAAPKDLVETLSAWSRAAPASIDKDTAAKCGANAAAEVAILTLCAPTRVPPLWIAPAKP